MSTTFIIRIRSIERRQGDEFSYIFVVHRDGEEFIAGAEVVELPGYTDEQATKFIENGYGLAIVMEKVSNLFVKKTV